jgi:hypothetical protein
VGLENMQALMGNDYRNSWKTQGSQMSIWLVFAWTVDVREKIIYVNNAKYMADMHGMLPLIGNRQYMLWSINEVQKW